MILACIVFLAGVLTILSPCILPVLPFVFTRADRKFSTNGLPMLIGMAITFAGVATLAAVGGSWVVRFNQFGRTLALVLLAAFAATLLSRRLADALARPFVALGNLLIQSEGAASGRDGIVTSLLLGVATGLLWAPCAGPILGLLLTGAALSGPTPRTTLLLFAYAAGAATSLAAAILVGGRLVAALKRSLGAGEWLRRALGVAVLVAVAGIEGTFFALALLVVQVIAHERLDRGYEGAGHHEKVAVEDADQLKKRVVTGHDLPRLDAGDVLLGQAKAACNFPLAPAAFLPGLLQGAAQVGGQPFETQCIDILSYIILHN